VDKSGDHPGASGERLAKFLAESGVTSRRRAEELITSGAVKVNGVTVVELYVKVHPTRDVITLNDERIRPRAKLYLVLYKPRGYMSDLKDPRGRKLARDLIKVKGRIFPVGRLDYDSEGLMVFTNDGELAHSVMHPRFGVTKEYVVKFRGILSESEMELIMRGAMIDGVRYKVADVSFGWISKSGDGWYRVVAEEGRNRLIRRLGEFINHPVLRLKRIRIGPVMLGDLMPGEYRVLGRKEIEKLKAGFAEVERRKKVRQ
jgi:23S rRNA pseudouridine2605 synthase